MLKTVVRLYDPRRKYVIGDTGGRINTWGRGKPQAGPEERKVTAGRVGIMGEDCPTAGADGELSLSLTRGEWQGQCEGRSL